MAIQEAAATVAVARLRVAIAVAVVLSAVNAASIAVATTRVVLAPVVLVPETSAAVLGVAATSVVLAPAVMIPGKPAAAASAALVIAAARVTYAVAPLGKVAVTVRFATILPRKSAVEMGMATHALLNRPAVVTGGAVILENSAVTVIAPMYAGLRKSTPPILIFAAVLSASAQVIM